jgi:hypothetical protein
MGAADIAAWQSMNRPRLKQRLEKLERKIMRHKGIVRDEIKRVNALRERARKCRLALQGQKP